MSSCRSCWCVVAALASCVFPAGTAGADEAPARGGGRRGRSRRTRLAFRPRRLRLVDGPHRAVRHRRRDGRRRPAALQRHHRQPRRRAHGRDRGAVPRALDRESGPVRGPALGLTSRGSVPGRLRPPHLRRAPAAVLDDAADRDAPRHAGGAAARRPRRAPDRRPSRRDRDRPLRRGREAAHDRGARGRGLPPARRARARAPGTGRDRRPAPRDGRCAGGASVLARGGGGRHRQSPDRDPPVHRTVLDLGRNGRARGFPSRPTRSLCRPFGFRTSGSRARPSAGPTSTRRRAPGGSTR